MPKEGIPSSSMLIRTKFSPPRLTRLPVRRAAVLDLLSAGMSRALTLLKAPAGFGKTTMLTTWRESLIQRGYLVAWLTLDQDDNDENRFVDYLTASLAETLNSLYDKAPEFRNVANLGKMVSAKTQVTSIINVLDNVDHEITLILDDYDKVDTPPVHELIAFLLRHIPSNLHIVMACRADPPLPLASLRARDQLVEIETETLRFHIEETQAFLSETIALRLTPTETRALHEATEGWVAGLQIATLAMPGRTLNRLISAFPRQSRALNDYLVENVLTRIPSDMVEFMLRTAILDRLNGPLCTELTGTDDAADKLEWLVQQNMFLQPLDENGEWYRYHGLFLDFLRSQLSRHMPKEMSDLHLRAAEWFSEQKLWAEAVRHALDAGRVELAAEWLERCAIDELRNSRVRNFLGWIQKLPAAAVRQRPSLRIALIWALILTVQTEQARALVDEVEAQLREESPPNAEELRRTLRGQCVSIMSMQDHVSRALELGEQVWSEKFPDNRRPRNGFVWGDEAYLNVMLHLYRKVGDLEAARRVREFYRPNEDVSQNLFMLSYRTCLSATLHILEKEMRVAAGKLEEMLGICEQITGRRAAASALLAATLAGIYYQWSRLDEVENLLADRFDIIDDVCFIEPIQSAYLSMALVQSNRGNLDVAHTTLDRAEMLAEKRGWPRLTAACITERVRLWLLENRCSDVERSICRLDAVVAITLLDEPEAVDILTMQLCARSRLLLHTGRHLEAIKMLAEAINLKEGRNGADTPYEIAQLRILLAIALHQNGNIDDAKTCLNQVLELTENDGVIRLLADEGAAIAPLLKRLAATTPEHSPRAAYLEKLLNSMGVESPRQEIKSLIVEERQTESQEEDTFSRRELDILELVTQKLSNKQIAKTLFITPETVKWHLKNIYKKLGVSDRRLAAQRGKQMPQIPPPPETVVEDKHPDDGTS